jgi:hypothetical protein
LFSLLLPLFTHWTLQESMTNDPLFMCKSQIWSQRGEQDFRHLLAKLGSPFLFFFSKNGQKNKNKFLKDKLVIK